MKNMMNYHGYYGTMEYSDEDECFFGKVLGMNDLVLFEGDSVKGLKEDFHRAVDEYLETCKQLGKEPEKYYKGSFNIRISPELHKRAVLAAEHSHQTLNSFVEAAIQSVVSAFFSQEDAESGVRRNFFR